MIYKINFKILKCLGYFGAFSLGILQTIVFSGSKVSAQNIVPDNTLGNENSRVEVLNSGGSPADRISGGAIRGQNLFHSFQEFNIGDGRTADFINSSNNIQNILTRVTGNNPSNILGTLRVSNDGGVISNPNFFLINPNGIVFGENASLDVPGSFVASTANGIQFGEQGFFSATEPGKSNLLAVNPSALFFNAVNNQAQIVNRSIATATVSGDVVNGVANRPINGLQVLDGKSLLLVGGNVSFDGGRLFAPGGKIELGGLTEVGTVGLGVDGDIFSLSFPDGVKRGDVSLRNESRVDTLAGDGGSIAINARNIDVSRGSAIFAGIGEGLGKANSQAGNIMLDATNSIKISDDSPVSNIINQNAVGNSGNINIKTKQLNMSEGGQVATLTFGEGDAGNVTVNASESVELKGGNNIFLTGLFAQVGQQGIGNAGNTIIEAENLSIIKGARVSASTFGKGNAGRVIIKAQETVSLEGKENNNILILNNVGNSASGDTSGIDINTGSLFVNNGAQIQSITRGKGNSGQIRIVARDKVSFDGNNGSPSGAFSLVDPNAQGNSGGLEVITDFLDIHNRAQLGSWTDGKGDSGNIQINAQDQVSLINSLIISEVSELGGVGNAGDIKITTSSLFLEDGSSLLADTENRGNAGNITIKARDKVVLKGRNSNRLTPTQISATVESNAVGEAGNIYITTESIFLSDGAQLRSETFGRGDSGNIFLQVENNASLSNSLIISEVSDRGGVGDAGDIEITTGSLFLRDGSSILTDTENTGNAGNITIEARNKVVLEGEGPASLNANRILPSQISATVESKATGKGGNINISAKKISVEDGGFISSRTFAQGNAGNITFITKKLLLNDGVILTSSNISSGGVINVAAKDIRLFGDSDIRTNVNSGIGGGGNINLTADTIIALDDSDILSFARDGRGGDITFNTEGFFSSSQFLPASAIADPNRLNGNNRVDINASGTISGNITGIPDTTFIQNSLNELPENQIDTNALISQTCIARSSDTGSTFNITGSSGFPHSPGNADISNYPTNSVRGISKTTLRNWKKGDPIIEPDGVYRLPDGKIVLSRNCS